MTKHKTLAFFIPHRGCPHQCSFCDQRTISGTVQAPTPEEVTQTCQAMLERSGPLESAEIAFFGGSFTAIDREYMISLLKAANKYIKSNEVKGIRISTRPDYIDKEILDILKSYGVTSIELGAQSMSDDVLLANDRGHSAESVFKSSELIKSYGFSLGLQMMTGLYKSDIQKDLYTAETFVKINPDTVRIYPTVIMKDTKLAELYLNGEYTPYSLEKSVNLCSKLIELFEKNNIKIIRLGLHYSDSLVNNSYGDNYHPAFKELCENKLFYDKFIEKAKDFPDLNEIKTVVINSKSLSKFLGQKRSNVKKLNELGYNFSVCFDDSLQKYELYLK